MPYNVFRRGQRYCVYKINADGEPVGEPVGSCHETEDEAMDHMRALYANVDETARPLDDLGDLGVAEAEAQWKVGAARNLRIVRRSSWDGDGAKSRIFRWAGFSGDNPSSAKARRAFLIYDAGNPDLKGSYKLPFADIVDGELVAVDAGLRAAASRLPRTDAPEAVLKRARAVLDAYFARLDEDEGDEDERELDAGAARRVVLETVDLRGVDRFKGRPPVVPIAAGVDYDALVRGDPDPMFVTLAVGEIGAVSRNGLRWDEALANAVVEQINQKRPVGIMGHIPEGEESTAFPIPVLHWVGATQIDGRVWAKAYVVPGEAREYIRRQKAVGGQIATSIYGRGEHVYGADGTFTLREFNLEQLDLAPYERAALKPNGDFQITAETVQPTGKSYVRVKERQDMAETQEKPLGPGPQDRAQIIAEMTPADAHLLPDAVRQAIIRQYETEEAASRVAELEQARDAATARVAELEGKLAELTRASAQLEADLAVYKAQEFRTYVHEQVAQNVRIEALAPIVERMVVAELAGAMDRERADAILKAYLESDEYTRVAEQMARTLGGPRAFTNADDKRGNGLRLEDTPEARKRARQFVGI